MSAPLLIDDFARDDLVSSLGTAWEGTSDQVMGGISQGRLVLETRDGRRWLRLTGRVHLENDGGFIQMGLALAPGGRPLDLSAYAAIRFQARGNGESYGCHLRTTACARPWQSYRSTFTAPPEPAEVTLPFTGFTPHRVDAPFDPSGLRRLSLIAIGRAFDADLAVTRLELLP